MIKNGNNGLLFDNNNHNELAQKMLWTIENQAIALTIIQQAHQAVASYRWGNIKDKLYTTYGISA